MHDGIEVEVTIQQVHKDPTKAMMGYYWVICKLAADESGYTKEEIDEMICRECLLRNREMKDQYVESKANLTDQEFSDLIDFAKNWVAINLGVVAPPPNQNWGNDSND